jgi:hypothetical protein
MKKRSLNKEGEKYKHSAHKTAKTGLSSNVHGNHFQNKDSNPFELDPDPIKLNPYF